MIYTPNIQKAITFATTVHHGQNRKGKEVPYITHPLTVGLLLAKAGASEAVIIAGILHDTIEDCDPYGSITTATLTEAFSSIVADLVASVTETDKTLPWQERKDRALAHIKEFSHDSLLVKSADVLANGTELIADYKAEGDVVFNRFNAPKELIIENQLTVISAILTRWPDTPLRADLKELAIQLKHIQALSIGGVAYASWSIEFIKYEMKRAYSDSKLYEEVIAVCDKFLKVLTRYQSDDDAKALKRDVIPLKEDFHALILRSEADEQMVHMLLVTHVADTLASLQHELSPASA
jgi:hypothetical protein